MLTDPTALAETHLNYNIRCFQLGHFAIFVPHQQQLTLVDGTSQTKADLGFAPSRLLEILIQRADSIVTREEILSFAWPERVVTQNSLNQAISKLRELLGDEESKQIIKTVPRRGYSFDSTFLATPEQITAISQLRTHEENTTSGSAPEQPEKSLVIRKIPPFTLALLMTALFMLISLFWRIDWGLIARPGLTIQTQYTDNKRLIYTAPNESRLKSLIDEMTPLRERLIHLAHQPETLIFNRANDYYDLICIDQGTVKFLSIHRSQLITVSDRLLLGCLK